MKSQDLVRFEIGTPLSRLNEQAGSPCYSLYDQAIYKQILKLEQNPHKENKFVR